MSRHGLDARFSRDDSRVCDLKSFHLINEIKFQHREPTVLHSVTSGLRRRRHLPECLAIQKRPSALLQRTERKRPESSGSGSKKKPPWPVSTLGPLSQLTRSLIFRCLGVLALALVALFAALFFSAGTACAHDPRFACSPRDGNAVIRIIDPEKSWAFYGHLKAGESDHYSLTTAKYLDVPWSVLVDKRDAAKPARPVAKVLDSGGQVVAVTKKLDQSFYEPFSHETYITSPNVDLKLPAGTYQLVVSMRGGSESQRYTLAIGRNERFGILDIPYALGAIVRIRSHRY